MFRTASSQAEDVRVLKASKVFLPFLKTIIDYNVFRRNMCNQMYSKCDVSSALIILNKLIFTFISF